MKKITLNQAGQWLKHSENPLAKILFVKIRVIRQAEIPAPQFVVMVGLLPVSMAAHTSMLVQETAKINPFPEDISVSFVIKADVVHTHHIGPLLYAGMAARLAYVTCLIHTGNDAWHLNNPRRRKLQRQAIRLIRPQLVADANSVAANGRLT